MNILLDSDFLYGLHAASDPHHKTVVKMFNEFADINVTLFVTNLVVEETATVISHKVGQKQAVNFHKSFNKIVDRLIFVDKKLEKKAWDVFVNQTKKGTSFVDCANLAVFKHFKLDKIASFDMVYPRGIRC